LVVVFNHFPHHVGREREPELALRASVRSYNQILAQLTHTHSSDHYKQTHTSIWLLLVFNRKTYTNMLVRDKILKKYKKSPDTDRQKEKKDKERDWFTRR
jgi:hypothetical protein